MRRVVRPSDSARRRRLGRPPCSRPPAAATRSQVRQARNACARGRALCARQHGGSLHPPGRCERKTQTVQHAVHLLGCCCWATPPGRARSARAGPPPRRAGPPLRCDVAVPHRAAQNPGTQPLQRAPRAASRPPPLPGHAGLTRCAARAQAGDARRWRLGSPAAFFAPWRRRAPRCSSPPPRWWPAPTPGNVRSLRRACRAAPQHRRRPCLQPLAVACPVAIARAFAASERAAPSAAPAAAFAHVA